MNPKNKAKNRQRDRARAKEKKVAAVNVKVEAESSSAAVQSTLAEFACDDSSSESSSQSVSAVLATSKTTPSYSNLVSNKRFLTPQDGKPYHELIQDHYQGFVHLPADEVTPSNFRQLAKTALERLRDANYYQYDVVMAGGKNSSRTFVKRTLVGDPGITYKYLGLRLFAHAWSGPGVLPVMKSIGDLNQHMIQMTQGYDNRGKCDYNLTLINYMEPTSHTKIGFKDEAYYGMGKVSVSWHADSSLEENSSIGVYHCLPTQRSAKWDWRLALRRSPDSGADAKDVLPVSVPTKDGDAYFLLGRFNENHQHCVLAGSEANRISSTHRVAVTEEDTYDYILKRVKGAVKRFRLQLQGDPSQMDRKVVIFCQRVLTEVEMEWIAQYWLQGAEHCKTHVWWDRPMKTLEALWSTLEECTFQLYQLCRKEPCAVPRLVVKGFLAELTARQESRQFWDERRADKIYQRRITQPFRPVARPLFGDNTNGQLGKDLTAAIDELSRVLANLGTGSSKVDKTKQGKKEEMKSKKTDPKSRGSSGGRKSVVQERKGTIGLSAKKEMTESQTGTDGQRKRSMDQGSGEGRKKKKKQGKPKPVKLARS